MSSVTISQLPKNTVSWNLLLAAQFLLTHNERVWNSFNIFTRNRKQNNSLNSNTFRDVISCRPPLCEGERDNIACSSIPLYEMGAQLQIEITIWISGNAIDCCWTLLIDTDRAQLAVSIYSLHFFCYLPTTSTTELAFPSYPVIPSCTYHRCDDK